jgi:hypothetical protein
MKFIIDFTKNSTDEQIKSYLFDQKITVISTFENFNKTYHVECETLPQKTDIVEYVIDDENHPIELLTYPVSPGSDFPKVEFSSTDDKDWWKLACLWNPNFENDIQSCSRRGDTAFVYIVDSGVQSSHPEFEFADIENLYSFNGDFTDYNGHGTAIASVIAGKTCSLSNPYIKSVKIFQDGVTTMQSHLVAAFDTIIKKVLETPNKLHIVNLSWSIPKNEYIESKINQLIEHGVFVTAAAGNSGIPIENVTPASMPKVFTVGSFNQHLEPCNFSDYTGPISVTTGTVNYGALSVWAPGSAILCANINGGYTYLDGTSISTGIQSAAIAYNSYAYALPDGTYPDFFYDEGELFNISSTRQGILDLSDKYSDSTNKITSFRPGSNDPDVMGNFTIGGISIQGYSGQRFGQLFPEFMHTSVNICDPLPSGFSLQGPWLLGSMTVTEEFNYQSTAVIKNTGGSNTYEVPVKIKIFPGTMPDVMDLNTFSNSIDAPVDIRLMAGCALGHPYCNGTCVGVSCGYYASGGKFPKCACSDILVKRNIVFLDTMSNGVKIYKFQYHDSDTEYVGAIAQDLLNGPFSNAVGKTKDGYYCIKYDQLGFDLMTYEEYLEKDLLF